MKKSPRLHAQFGKGWIACLMIALGAVAPGWAQVTEAALTQETPAIHVTFDAAKPGLSALSFDSLQRGSFRPNPIVDPGASAVEYTVTTHDGWVVYAPTSDPAHAVWEMRCEGNKLRMRSLFRPGGVSQDVIWKFNPDVAHATLLGHVTPAGDIALPALMHLPGMGSLRIYSSGGSSAVLHYDALRRPELYVKVTFPAATAEQKKIEYTLETAAIYPAVPGVDLTDPRYDGFRREWMNAFQLQARAHALANNSASDIVGFCLFFYGDMARYTPELVKGLTALDIVRDSLDRYLGGVLTYGQPGYKGIDPGVSVGNGREWFPHASSDTYPSLLIAAYDYADGSGDIGWLRKSYPGLRKWAELMIEPNADGSPLIEFPVSGNTGSWPEKLVLRPANWWDAVGFGHQDAYSNALGYRALRSMAALADRVGETADAARYRKRAQELRDAYAPAFLDPATGVLAGWRSADGQLHDYYFTFVNGIAVRYGLLPDEQAKQVEDRIVAKMDAVGFHNFSIGIPGNLAPIHRGDYVDHIARWGGPSREDGTDTFGVYQNGGATACYSYFTIGALYHLGEKAEGDKILMPMLESFAKQRFSDRGKNGLTYEWIDWQGNPHGYEGLLVDSYYALMGLLDREQMIQKMP
ncbi:MAG: hypothetical protein ABR956_03740 [Terracidiphilus sp.]